MNSVMISIRTEWCKKIASGRKTLELRKSFPKLELPFKCYIYCTKDKHDVVYPDEVLRGYISGMVIGEFVCDSVLSHCEMANADLAEQMGCMKREKIREYAGDKEVFGWHISDLKIYDKPKNLSEFCHLEKTAERSFPKRITRPPQSWCYVEENTDD